MHTFYIPGDITDQNFLSEEESKHAIRVLRLNNGDYFQVVNGSGTLVNCVIKNADPKRCRFEVTAVKQINRKPYYIFLAIAPTKNMDRMEWMIEKCTEIGIDEISFFHSEYSERKTLKLDRLIRKSISALKQSNNYYLPKLNPIESFESILAKIPHDYDKFIAFLSEKKQNHLIREAVTGNKYCVLIGPEGDFSMNEIDQAVQKGFKPVSLGDTILRTETAGIYACTALNILNQENKSGIGNYG